MWSHVGIGFHKAADGNDLHERRLWADRVGPSYRYPFSHCYQGHRALLLP